MPRPHQKPRVIVDRTLGPNQPAMEQQPRPGTPGDDQEVSTRDPARQPQDARRGESQRNQAADCRASAEDFPGEYEHTHQQENMSNRAAADQRLWIRAPDPRGNPAQEDRAGARVRRARIMPPPVPIQGLLEGQPVDGQVTIEVNGGVQDEGNAEQDAPGDRRDRTEQKYDPGNGCPARRRVGSE